MKMLNIFKTFKENKELLTENEKLKKENEKLKNQNEALMQFKGNFDNYYHDISAFKIITRDNSEAVTLRGIYNINDKTLHYPSEEYKETIAERLLGQLIPFFKFDIVDNRAYGTKDMVGTITVVKGR